MHRLQVGHAMQHTRIFNAHTHPYVLRPRQVRGEFRQPFAAFGEYLKRVARAVAH